MIGLRDISSDHAGRDEEQPGDSEGDPATGAGEEVEGEAGQGYR